MATPVRIARYGGVHSNITAVIVPQQGQSRGLPYTTKTMNSIGYDLGVKYGHIGGTQIGPVNTILQGATPKWSGEMNLVEVTDLHKFIGAG